MPPSPGPQAATPGTRAGKFRTLCFIFAGLLLPLLTLGIELGWHWSAEALFDPLPTPLHALLIASVPLSNGWLFWSLHRQHLRHARALAWSNAFAIGIALYYSLLYLPTSPLGVLLILWFGFGFLLLAPLLSLIAAVRLRSRLKQQAAQLPALPHAGWGMALALLVLLLAQAPLTVTQLGLSLAVAQDEPSRMQGIRLLRLLGNEKILLELCYERSAVRTDLLGLPIQAMAPVTSEQARNVFYRVTGTPFNAHPAPPRKNHREFFSFDNDRGGESVGTRAEGVMLADSRLDGSLDAHAAIGYLEWTMVFNNTAQVQNEARGQILLPPGAAVSRLTLWINGEEREAAFGSRGEVRKAYEKIVRQQRDPVLVTTQGKDRILLQLFPVPPGGQMKVRIGITTPLQLASLQQARLNLPAFREQNFEFAPGLRHALWIEAKHPLNGPAELQTSHAGAQQYALRGQVAASSLAAAPLTVTASRDGSSTPVWSVDDKAGDGSIVVQTISQQSAWQPAHVVLVLDGSRAMRAVREEIARAVQHLPPHWQLSLVIATDRNEPAAWRQLTAADAASQIRAFDFAGGRDNQSALNLAAAWADSASSAILWLHGPQPLAFAMPESLQQWQERRGGQSRFYELEAIPGPNRLLENGNASDKLISVAQHGSVQASLAQQFLQWQPGATELVVQRKRVLMQHDPASDQKLRAALQDASRTSGHLVRLWALEQVSHLARDPASRASATELAQRYQLVTPLTGAVVLETRQDFQAAGLEPVPPGSVPTIPEPETWVLIVLVLLLLIWQRKSIPALLMRQPPRKRFRNPLRIKIHNPLRSGGKDGHQ